MGVFLLLSAKAFFSFTFKGGGGRGGHDSGFAFLFVRSLEERDFMQKHTANATFNEALITAAFQ